MLELQNQRDEQTNSPFSRNPSVGQITSMISFHRDLFQRLGSPAASSCPLILHSYALCQPLSTHPHYKIRNGEMAGQDEKPRWSLGDELWQRPLRHMGASALSHQSASSASPWPLSASQNHLPTQSLVFHSRNLLSVSQGKLSLGC